MAELNKVETEISNRCNMTAQFLGRHGEELGFAWFMDSDIFDAFEEMLEYAHEVKAESIEVTNTDDGEMTVLSDKAVWNSRFHQWRSDK